MDGAPFVGWSSRSDGYLVATGFMPGGSRNGTPRGSSPCATRKANAWVEMFDPTRGRAAPGAPLRRERGGGRHCIGGGSAVARRVDESSPERAAILEVDGDETRPLRDEDGATTRVRRLHPYGLPGRVERGRPHLGLPLPRLALRSRRHSSRRTGDASLGRDRSTRRGEKRLTRPLAFVARAGTGNHLNRTSKRKEHAVDSDRIEGKAKETEGEIQQKWGEAKDAGSRHVGGRQGQGRGRRRRRRGPRRRA